MDTFNHTKIGVQASIINVFGKKHTKKATKNAKHKMCIIKLKCTTALSIS